jgi:hypothetical protein
MSSSASRRLRWRRSRYSSKTRSRSVAFGRRGRPGRHSVPRCVWPTTRANHHPEATAASQGATSRLPRAAARGVAHPGQARHARRARRRSATRAPGEVPYGSFVFAFRAAATIPAASVAHPGRRLRPDHRIRPRRDQGKQIRLSPASLGVGEDRDLDAVRERLARLPDSPVVAFRDLVCRPPVPCACQSPGRKGMPPIPLRSTAFSSAGVLLLVGRETRVPPYLLTRCRR